MPLPQVLILFGLGVVALFYALFTVTHWLAFIGAGIMLLATLEMQRPRSMGKDTKTIESAYFQGINAGHEWFHNYEVGRKYPDNPYPKDSKEYDEWDKGFEQGEDDAYNAYYI